MVLSIKIPGVGPHAVSAPRIRPATATTAAVHHGYITYVITSAAREGQEGRGWALACQALRCSLLAHSLLTLHCTYGQQEGRNNEGRRHARGTHRDGKADGDSTSAGETVKGRLERQQE